MTIIKIDGYVVSNNGRLDTTLLTNGRHTLTMVTTWPNGRTVTTSRVIIVDNRLNPLQTTRNWLVAAFRSKPVPATAAALIAALFFAALGYILAHRALRHRLWHWYHRPR
jgi:glycerol uptake facilitator-like aquaporin